MNLDNAYVAGLLQQYVERATGNADPLPPRPLASIPIVNRVSAGYPQDFTDLAYPARVADEYAACPNVDDPHAFAARVFGDSMSPRYTDGDVVVFSPAATPASGDDCFVRMQDGQTTFKRVYFEPDDMLRLQPRNPK